MSDNLQAPAAKDVEEGKICAILIYIVPIIGIIWYFVDEKQKNNPFAKYHVKQGLALLIIGMVVSILTCGFGGIAHLILAIIGVINAANGEMKELPVIGKFGEQWFKF